MDPTGIGTGTASAPTVMPEAIVRDGRSRNATGGVAALVRVTIE